MLRNQLKPAIRRKRDFLSSKMYLQYDNTAHHTVKQIQDLKLEVLPNLPYSPDVAPRICTRLAPKDALCGSHFRSDEEVMEAVNDWLAQQPNDFFPQGIYARMEHRWCEVVGTALMIVIELCLFLL